MPGKTYSAQEIDSLRKAIENRYLFGRFSPDWSVNHQSRSYMEVEMTKVVEEQVRTYMLAGVIAEDLYASEKG